MHYKDAREIELMRQAGALVAEVLDEVCGQVAPGVTTGELNATAERMIASAGAEALFKGVVNRAATRPFPAALCISVNDEVVHGIPGDRVLQTGDAVSIDCGVRMAGYCGDAARTVPVGVVAPEVTRLLQVTEEALQLAIAEVAPGRMWSEVAARIQQHVESAGMAVIRDFVGHGIGQEMHEEPKVPNYSDGTNRRGDFRLEPGLTLAIEPMVALGDAAVRYADADAWVIVTRDGSFAAHFEHTVAVRKGGAEVLTVARSAAL
ncbi:MAG TPA: type I methionyl aminopeptidase, partial [Phycisphaerae bacterium]|nr:type I methionyl aminopeptidase [Phycisphaerae bacterium]